MNKNESSFWAAICSGLFWSWNAIFLAFMVLGFAPRLLPEIIRNVQSGLIPVNFLIYGVILTLVPVAAVILGLTALRRSPTRLFALGYVIEGPLMLLMVIRFFIIRQATPAFIAIMIIAGLGMAGFLWYLLDPEMERRGRWNNLIKLVGLTLILIVSLYASVWIFFYTIPVLAAVSKWMVYTLLHLGEFFKGIWQLLRDIFSQQWYWIPLSILGIMIGLYTATLFVLTPIAAPLLSIRAFLRSLRTTSGQYGRLVARMAVLAVVAVTAVIFILTARQPQKQAFELLKTPPATVEQARELLARQDLIRSGLLNAYLAPYRYISSVGEVDHITWLYRDALGMRRENAFSVQRLYEGVAFPFLYKPVTPRDPDQEFIDRMALQKEPEQAAELYQWFFDEPIITGERETITQAVRATWSGDQATAAWQAVDDREVHLERQEIAITEHEGWAEVELMEVYHNLTNVQQEVMYYFNLPESAVLTGVWLGNSPDRSQRFAFQVAPRGAAQQVYREERERSYDPALLEQIGPRQYRLRVFPIENDQANWDIEQSRMVTENTFPMYLWMTYRTLSVEGVWPLPQLAHKTNVFWDQHTERLLNGQTVQASEDAWMPEAPAAPETAAIQRANFPNGQSVIVQPAKDQDLPALPEDVRLAVVIDRSKSMEDHALQVTQATARLRDLAPGAQVDVYLTASTYSGDTPTVVSLEQLQPQSEYYFGGQNPAELLAQFESLQGDRAYDGILILTDATPYALGASELDTRVPDAPLWMVHLDSSIPLGYDDKTLEAIQASGGGVTGHIDEALTRLAVYLDSQRQSVNASAYEDVLDGYILTVLPTTDAVAAAPGAVMHTENDGLTALMARQVVLAEMRRNRGTITQLDTLDMLHGLAKQYGIVTPYSSMIVLVNARQIKRLQKLEEGQDRYEREFEVQPPLVGVPEPEEWLLLGIMTALLVWYAYRRREAISLGAASRR